MFALNFTEGSPNQAAYSVEFHFLCGKQQPKICACISMRVYEFGRRVGDGSGDDKRYVGEIPPFFPCSDNENNGKQIQKQVWK